MASKPAKREPSRLAAADWIEAGLDVLAAQGVDKVLVEPLAKRLGVTKGSFYWHFKDRSDLLQEMLQHWRRRATVQVIERIQRRDDSPEDRFRALMRVPFGRSSRSKRGAEVELSIRLWGRSDDRVRAVLSEIDELRLNFIANLLAASGVPTEIARARAIQAYCFMRVATTLRGGDESQLFEVCVADFLSDRCSAER